jgi:hypothetical protein
VAVLEGEVRRHQSIATQGHDEKTSAVPAFIACRNCPDSRLRTSPWSRACPAVDRHATPLVVPVQPVHVVTEGRYFGKTKQGG